MPIKRNKNWKENKEIYKQFKKEKKMINKLTWLKGGHLKKEI